jgi:hypothetical protein
MGSPCRNDPHRVAPLRESDKEGLAVHLANRLTAFLTIFTPLVYPLQAALVCKHARRVRKIEAAFYERLSTFFFVPFKYHIGGIAV